VNPYRALLSGMFWRAIRLGLLGTNPVKGVAVFKESNQRVAYLTADEESAIRDTLPVDLRPHFTVRVHTGLRWSEQMQLRWQDVDLMTGIITIPRSKNGYTRRVPMNSVVRSVLVDLGSQRRRPNDPGEVVFPCRHAQSDKVFPKAVERAQAALQPPHLRLEARDGRCRPPDRQGTRGLADARDGPTVRSPGAGASAGGR
jgi:integrase